MIDVQTGLIIVAAFVMIVIIYYWSAKQSSVPALEPAQGAVQGEIVLLNAPVETPKISTSEGLVVAAAPGTTHLGGSAIAEPAPLPAIPASIDSSQAMNIESGTTPGVWGPWGGCQGICGQGTQTRTCTSGTCEGPETQTCNLLACDIVTDYPIPSNKQFVGITIPFTEPPSPTLYECGEVCSKATDCRGFTYTMPAPIDRSQRVVGGLCQMYSSVSGEVPDPTTLAYYRAPRALWRE